MNTAPPNLSSREMALLSEWELAGVTRVRAADIASGVGGALAANQILARLAKKGALDRVSHGVYAVRPLRAVGQPWAWSAAVLAAHALGEAPYYVGGGLALTLHRLTTQIHHAVVDVFVPVPRENHSIDQVRIAFHLVGWRGAFEFGLTALEIDGVPVTLSDPERTLLDVLDRPELVGGPNSAIETFRAGMRRVDVEQLVTHATRWGRTSLKQRAGYLLEQAGVPDRILVPLVTATRLSNPVPLLKGQPRPVGTTHPSWRVAELEVARP